MASERIAEILATLVVELREVRARLHKLETSSLQAKPPIPSPSAHTSGVGSSSRKGQMVAPTSTPTKHLPTTLPNINSLSNKAAFEKTVITLSIPDQQTGHVVGRAGTGLKQIHEVSHAKISVAPPKDSSGLRSVTIRGTAREVGDAISALGKRLAGRRVRPRKKKTEDTSPPPKVQNNPTPIPIPTPIVGMPPPVKTPSSAPGMQTTKTVASRTYTPMSITSSTPATQSRPSGISPGSPMEIDAAAKEYQHRHFGPRKSTNGHLGLQTARRSRPYIRK